MTSGGSANQIAEGNHVNARLSKDVANKSKTNKELQDCQTRVKTRCLTVHYAMVTLLKKLKYAHSHVVAPLSASNNLEV